MKFIPLHSLVILVGTSKLKEQEILENFEDFEVISKSKITKNLFGDTERHIHSDIINSELYKMINLKLSLGERAVLSDLNLSRNKRVNIANIGKKFGVPVYYIIHHDQTYYADKSKVESFLENENQILSGDNIANVVDTRIEPFSVTKKFPYNNLIEEITKRGFSGITVAGDVHGNAESLKNALDWSLARNMLFLQLGDLVDYGPDSLECVDIIHDRLIRGRALFVIGNHDKKIEKWLNQDLNIKKNKEYLKYKNPVLLSDSNKDTIDKIESLSDSSRKIFESKFNTIMNLGRYHYNIGNFSFAHAGFHQEMFNLDCDRLYGKYEAISIYGNLNDGYDWFDCIDTDKTIMVGHTIKNKLIPEKINLNMGGEIIFQDTGSGKGGYLTTTDIVLKDNVLNIQSSNRW